MSFPRVLNEERDPDPLPAGKNLLANHHIRKRPFEVAFTGWLFIAIGIFATVFQLRHGTLDRWMIVIIAEEFVAIVAGFFLLRGARWARWVILAWIGGHAVALSFLSLSSALPHLALLLIFGYVLLGPPTSQYFRGQPD